MKKILFLLVLIILGSLAVYLWMMTEGVSHHDIIEVVHEEGSATRAHIDARVDRTDSKVDQTNEKLDRIEAKLDRILKIAERPLPDAL